MSGCGAAAVPGEGDAVGTGAAFSVRHHPCPVPRSATHVPTTIRRTSPTTVAITLFSMNAFISTLRRKPRMVRTGATSRRFSHSGQARAASADRSGSIYGRCPTGGLPSWSTSKKPLKTLVLVVWMTAALNTPKSECFPVRQPHNPGEWPVHQGMIPLEG
jgi:hypothetical protein